MPNAGRGPCETGCTDRMLIYGEAHPRPVTRAYLALWVPKTAARALDLHRSGAIRESGSALSPGLVQLLERVQKRRRILIAVAEKSQLKGHGYVLAPHISYTVSPDAARVKIAS